jgi:predicted PurR-regulated permease PerM
VKRLLDSWVPAAFIVIVFLGLGTGVVVQQISHTSEQLKQQYEQLDLMNFNQQLIDTNHKLRIDNEKADQQIQHMDNFIRQMYNRLRLYENLPPFPGEDKQPNRSDANWIHDAGI